MPSKEVEPSLDIPTGDYTGTIEKNVISTHQGYEYHETFIKMDIKDNPILKLGVPFSITEKTSLGQMLKKFGAELKVGEPMNTDDILKIGSPVKFSVLKAKGKKGDIEFSNIQADTLMPNEEKVE